jgi:ATP-dependent DNA helicase DinG
MRVVALEPGPELVEATVETLAVLARLLGGRTLGLFTSLRRMREAAELLAERLRGEGLEVLLPRRMHDDPAALVERFSRSGGGGVLLGARTFWQGLDIPGPALQAVVIEKLPFEVPTELRRRRDARLRAAGEDPFERASLGKMLLNLKQMAGRLIRSETDRGIAVIVEARPDRRYFSRLPEALPPGCPLRVARIDALAALLAEVGALAAGSGPEAGRTER